MEEKTMVSKNLVLDEEFVRYLVEQPGLVEPIPAGATVIVLPEDDPELHQANLELIEQLRCDGAPVVSIHTSRLAPEVGSRPMQPRLEPVSV
ncbi:MAG: hypothetical protein CVU38_19160 [Chloroflexi bacterium HGW-Chloroflexi-1]|nr:MAG: hypothetical protein CVU38_19160 [Chloroflexi bacterium HGW-Chloroflexi-1]